MTKALRVSFAGIDPVDMPLDPTQAAQLAPLLAAAAADPAIGDMLWPQLEVAVRTELAKTPGNAEKLDALPAGSLRPSLSIVDITS